MWFKFLLTNLSLLLSGAFSLNNSFNKTATSVSLAPPNNTLTPAQLATVYDTLISPSIPTNSWGTVCSGLGAPGATCAATISNTAGAQGRTILSVLSTDQTTGNSVTISAVNASVTVTNTTVGKNLILYNGYLSNFTSVTLSINSSSSCQLCTPEILVVDEHPLPVLSVASSQLNFGSVFTNSASLLQVQYTNWTLDSTNCVQFTSVNTTVQSYVNIFFQASGLSYKQLVLLTGGFLILGKNSSYNPISRLDFNYMSYTLNLTSGTFSESTLVYLYPTNVSGFYTFNSTAGIITNRLKLTQYTATPQYTEIANFVPLGYRYCFFTSITDTSTSTNSYVITPRTSPTLSKYFWIEQYIDSAKVLVNPQFCFMGVAYSRTCLTCNSQPVWIGTGIWTNGTLEIAISTNDFLNVGNQTYQITVRDTRNFESPASISFNYTMSISCCLSNLTVTQPAAVIYVIQQAQGSTSIIVNETNACGYNTTYVLGAGAPQWTSISGNVVSWYSNNLNVAPGNYSVPITVNYAACSGPQTYQTSLGIGVQICQVAIPVNQTYTIGAASANYSVLVAQNGACTYQATCSLGVSTPSWVTLSGCDVTWQTSDISIIPAQYSVPITMTFNTSPTISSATTLNINLTPCVGTFSAPAPANQTYSIKSPQASLTLVPTDSSSCGYVPTCSLAAGSPSWLSVNPTTCVYSWQTNDVTLTNTNQIVQAVVSFNTLPNPTIHTKNFTISLTACVGQFNVPTPTDQNYTISNPVASQTVNAADTSICGYTPTCSLALGSPAWLSVNPTTCAYSWSTTNLALANTNQTVTTIVSFNTLPTPTIHTQSFTISLAGCVGQFQVSVPANKSYNISSPQDSQTISRSDSSICGYTPSCSLAANSPSWLTVNPTTCVYSWSTSNAALTGSNQTVTTIVSFNTLPNQTNFTQSFVISMLCQGSFSVSAPTNQNYTISNPQASQTINASDTSICGYTPTCSLALGSPAWLSVNPTTCAYSWSTTNLALANTNQTVTTIVSFNTLPTPTIHTQSFTISLSGCIGQFVVSDPTNSSYTISNPTASQTINATDTSICGYTPTCSLALGSPSWLSVNPTTCAYSWSTTDQTLANTNQTVTTIVSFNTLPTTTNFTKNFTISMGCTCSPALTLISPWIQYRIGSAQGSQNLQATDSNLCGYPVTYTLGAQKPSWVSISGSTVSWQTNDLSLAAINYTVSITATFASQPQTSSITTDLVIALSNCAETYALTPPSNVSYTLWSSQQNQTITAVDSSSCGYTPSYALGTSPSWVSIQGNVISWYSNDNTLVSQPSYLVNIQITLAGVVHLTNFSINILPCQPNYQILTPSNATYMVYSNLASQNLTYALTSNTTCGYIPFCYLQNNPNWINVSNCQINWYNKNVSTPTPQLSAVNVILAYVDYRQTQIQLGNTTFYINLTANTEACKNATLIPNTISTVQLAYGNQTTLNLTPTDSVSTAFGVQQYCGNYTAVFPKTYGTWVTGNVSNYSLTLNQYQYTQANESIVVQFYMTNYSNVQANQTILLSGQDCIINSYVSSLTSNSINQTYTIGSGKTTISLPSYQLTPNCSNYYTTTMSVSQVAGPAISKTLYSISSQSFEIQVDDANLNGTSLVFQVTALLSDAAKTSNSNLLITLKLNVTSNSSNQSNQTNSTNGAQQPQPDQQASTQQQTKSNIIQEAAPKAPVFDYDLDQPANIPCLNLSQAKEWQFVTPTISSETGKQIQLKFDAPGLNSIFAVEQQSNQYVIKIAPKLPIQPYPGVFPSTITLQSQGSTAQQTYQIIFTSECPAKFAFGDQPKRPTPTIASISPTGLLTVKWSSAVKLPKTINQARLLQDKKGQFDDLFSVQIGDVGKNNVQQKQISFSYNIVEISNKTLQVQFNFSDPTQISPTQLNQDVVTLTFNNATFFKDAQSGMAVQQGLSIQAKLPRQSNPKQVQINSKTLGAAVQIGQAGMIASLIAPYLLSSVLSQLLSVIRSLTLIVHMFAISLLFPANCVQFFGMLFPLVMFDLFPTTPLSNYIFQFPQLSQDNPLTFQFNAVGYGSLLMVSNMGSMFFMIVLYPLMVLGAYTFYKVLSCKSSPPKAINRIKQSMKSFYKGAFWTMPISFIYESYFILLVQAFVGFQGLKFIGYELWSQLFCSVLAVITVFTLFIFPFGIWFIYKRSLVSANPTPSPKTMTPLETFKTYGTLDRLKIYSSNFTEDHLKYFYKTFGCLVEDVCLQKVGVNVAILNPLVDMGRKFIIAVAICYFTTWPTFVTFVFNFTTLFYVSFQWYYLPIENSNEQTRLIINEVTVLVVVYHLFTYTDYVDLDAQNTMGNSLIYLIILNGAVNVYLSIKEPALKLPQTLKQLFIKLKLRCQQKKNGQDVDKKSANKQITDESQKVTSNNTPMQNRRRQNTNNAQDSEQSDLKNTSYSKRRLIVQKRNEQTQGFKSADLSEPTYQESLPTLDNIESVSPIGGEDSKVSFEDAIMQRVKQAISQQAVQNQQSSNTLVFDSTRDKQINRRLKKRGGIQHNLSSQSFINMLPNLEEIPEVIDELQEIPETKL